MIAHRSFRTTLALPLLLAAGAAFAQGTRPSSRPGGSPFPPLGAPAGVFGAGVALEKGLGVAAAKKKVDALAGKTVRLEGRIKDVCQKKGCWMVLAEDGVEVRVRFQDYSFFVPRDAKGREAIVQGTLSVKTISEEVARHYAEEGGDPEAAKKIHGPQKTLAFLATGVEILGRREVPPQAAGTPEKNAALAARLEGAKRIAGLPGSAAKDFASALALLRRVKGPRTVEFSLCTETGGWLVFSPAKQKGEPFVHGYAVKKGTGEVYAF